MENCAWDVASATREAVAHSFLQPLERAIPMVATEDIGRLAAKLLQNERSSAGVVELEGPQRVSPNDIADAFAQVVGRPVRAQAVPIESWQPLFEAQGMHHPMPRIQMLQGFNAGWLDFEGSRESIVIGTTPLIEVIRKLISKA